MLATHLTPPAPSCLPPRSPPPLPPQAAAARAARDAAATNAPVAAFLVHLPGLLATMACFPLKLTMWAACLGIKCAAYALETNFCWCATVTWPLRALWAGMYRCGVPLASILIAIVACAYNVTCCIINTVTWPLRAVLGLRVAACCLRLSMRLLVNTVSSLVNIVGRLLYIGTLPVRLPWALLWWCGGCVAWILFNTVRLAFNIIYCAFYIATLPVRISCVSLRMCVSALGSFLFNITAFFIKTSCRLVYIATSPLRAGLCCAAPRLGSFWSLPGWWRVSHCEAEAATQPTQTQVETRCNVKTATTASDNKAAMNSTGKAQQLCYHLWRHSLCCRRGQTHASSVDAAMPAGDSACVVCLGHLVTCDCGQHT